MGSLVGGSTYNLERTPAKNSRQGSGRGVGVSGVRFVASENASRDREIASGRRRIKGAPSLAIDNLVNLR